MNALVDRAWSRLLGQHPPPGDGSMTADRVVGRRRADLRRGFETIPRTASRSGCMPSVPVRTATSPHARRPSRARPPAPAPRSRSHRSRAFGPLLARRRPDLRQDPLDPRSLATALEHVRTFDSSCQVAGPRLRMDMTRDAEMGASTFATSSSPCSGRERLHPCTRSPSCRRLPPYVAPEPRRRPTSTSSVCGTRHVRGSRAATRSSARQRSGGFTTTGDDTHTSWPVRRHPAAGGPGPRHRHRWTLLTGLSAPATCNGDPGELSATPRHGRERAARAERVPTPQAKEARGSGPRTTACRLDGDATVSASVARLRHALEPSRPLPRRLDSVQDKVHGARRVDRRSVYPPASPGELRDAPRDARLHPTRPTPFAARPRTATRSRRLSREERDPAHDPSRPTATRSPPSGSRTGGSRRPAHPRHHRPRSSAPVLLHRTSRVPWRR